MSSAEFGSSKPRLDARLEGRVFTAAVGLSVHHFEFVKPCVFNGVEVFSENSSFGDTIELFSEYFAGPYGWMRYKKFGKTFNITKGILQKYVLLPSTPQQGVRVTIEYNNTGSEAVNFWANYYVFTDSENVEPGLLQEGEDW